MSDNDDDDQQDLYDEFGNYIGPNLDDDDDDDETSSDEDDDDDDNNSNDDGSDNNNNRPARSREIEKSKYDNDSDDEVENRMIIPADVTTTTTSGAGPDHLSTAVVLHEDKEHYLSADQVYGDDVHVAVLDEDAMDLDTPIVEPVVTASHQSITIPGFTEPNESDYIYTPEYLGTHISNTTSCHTRRGIAIVGQYHHGKTSLIDLLLESTFTKSMYWGPRASLCTSEGGGPRYLDIWKSEMERQMSLVSTPITTLFNDTRGKSYCFTVVDNPGHINFHDESVSTMRIMDGAVIVIDVVEGLMLHTEMLLRQAVLIEGIPIVLVLNKLDRLIIELKLPPRDAYYKIVHLIDTVNDYIQSITNGKYPTVLSPERGNVAFASPQHGYIFTVQSFAQLYYDHQQQQNTSSNGNNNNNNNNNDFHLYDNGPIFGSNLTVSDFAKRLWGDCYLDPITKTFHKRSSDCPSHKEYTIERTFVTYILEPLYKIYTACLGEREPDVTKLLRTVGVLLRKEEVRSSVRPLLRTVFTKFFGTTLSTGAFVDMIVQHIPNPMTASYGKIARNYTGPVPLPTTTGSKSLDNNKRSPKFSKIVQSMVDCNPDGPLIIHCVKNYATPDGKSFMTFGRIYSGSVRPAEQVKVLGEGYTPSDDEDYASATIESVAIPRGRGFIPVSVAKAGNWVLLEGVDAYITKTATIVSPDLLRNTSNAYMDDDDNDDDPIHIFAPIKFPQAGGESVMKLAIEPVNPAELPKMVDGLRRISKAYPMARTKVEESGEHILLGTGELYMDCIMYDLRTVFSQIEIKVSDPIVSFRETVIDSTTIKCSAETANKRNRLTMMTEPLDDGLAEKLELGKVNIQEWDNKKLGRYFQSQYNWDLLASRSVWAFGDSSTHGPNILLDDTLPSEIDKNVLNTCRSSIVQGFQWATREGPLCEEPVRATKVKLLEATLADRPIYRGGGQIIPTARRVVHASIVSASPRLMEPIYQLQIQCPGSIVDSIQPVLSKRRGQIVQDRPVSGTTFHNVKAYLPMLDSFGFETDLRTFTQGQAMVYSVFDHWAIVPGDPLDRDIVLHPLEPSPNHHLAREILIKTRRRKGLSEDVAITKLFDGNSNVFRTTQ